MRVCCHWQIWVSYGQQGVGSLGGSEIWNLKSQISNLKSQISNLKSQISNLKSQIYPPQLNLASSNRRIAQQPIFQTNRRQDAKNVLHRSETRLSTIFSTSVSPARQRICSCSASFRCLDGIYSVEIPLANGLVNFHSRFVKDVDVSFTGHSLLACLNPAGEFS